MAQLTYNTITRDVAKLPEASVMALLSRGFSHFLGNEQASKIVSRIRGHLAGDGKASDVTKESVNAFRDDPANQERIAAWEKEVIEAALKALDEGTVGVRTLAGPRVTPLETAMRRQARDEVSTILKANGLKVPTGENTVELQGEAFTMEQLIDRRLDKHGDRIRKESEKRLADERKKRERLAAEAQGKSPDELGL